MNICEKIVSRYDKLNSARMNFSCLYQDIAEFFYPTKANITTKRYPGTQNNQRIYDSTAVLSASRLASSLQSTLTSDVVQWFDLVTTNEALNRMENVKRWLADSTDRMFVALQLSNFGSAANETYQDLTTFGCSLMLEEEAVPVRGGFGGLVFQTYYQNEYVWDVDESQRVNEVYRSNKMMLTDIVERFGEKNLTTKMQEAWRNGKYEAEFTIIHAVLPRSDYIIYGPQTRMPWASVYVCLEDKEIVKESGYRRFPYVAPRFSLSSDESYGRSPAMDAVPDTRTLNRIVELELRSMVKAVNPPLTTDDDGVLGGTIVLKPGGITYVRQGSYLKALESGVRFDVVNLKKMELQDAIRKAFFMDQLFLPPQQNTPPTAAEINRRTEQMFGIMGPQASRLVVELLRPLVRNTFDIMRNAGAFDEPPVEVLEEFARTGQPVITVNFKGALARAQKMNDVIAAERWLAEVVGPAAQINPESIDMVDTDEFVRMGGERLGVPLSIVRDPASVTKIRKQRANVQAAAIKQQQQMQMLETMGKAGLTQPAEATVGAA